MKTQKLPCVRYTFGEEDSPEDKERVLQDNERRYVFARNSGKMMITLEGALRLREDVCRYEIENKNGISIGFVDDLESLTVLDPQEETREAARGEYVR